MEHQAAVHEIEDEDRGRQHDEARLSECDRGRRDPAAARRQVEDEEPDRVDPAPQQEGDRDDHERLERVREPVDQERQVGGVEPREPPAEASLRVALDRKPEPVAAHRLELAPRPPHRLPVPVAERVADDLGGDGVHQLHQRGQHHACAG